VRTLVWNTAFVRAFEYDNWILFEFVRSPEADEEEILLLTMGTRDEVY
jgi:hypothetical protein